MSAEENDQQVSLGIATHWLPGLRLDPDNTLVLVMDEDDFHVPHRAVEFLEACVNAMQTHHITAEDARLIREEIIPLLGTSNRYNHARNILFTSNQVDLFALTIRKHADSPTEPTHTASAIVDINNYRRCRIILNNERDRRRSRLRFGFGTVAIVCVVLILVTWAQKMNSN